MFTEDKFRVTRNYNNKVHVIMRTDGQGDKLERLNSKFPRKKKTWMEIWTYKRRKNGP